MSDKKEPQQLPGSHLAKEDHVEADTVLRLIGRMAFRSLAWIGIYVLGYFNFSIGWLVAPMILSSLRDQWKKEKLHKLSNARLAALTDEKSVIQSRIRVEDLPSWVFFPDKDRAEWLNSIVSQLWPNVGHYTRKLISESIEPSVATALQGYGLKGFKFEKVVLGQVPPRITGIKVYDKNINRNEIIMDMDIILASDCDVKFSVKTFRAQISDFSLKGILRIVLTPLVPQIPIVGGIQAYFLTPPEIDFDLGGIANALDAPGFSTIVRKIILEQVGYIMVLPNKFTIPLIEGIENKILKCPNTAGVLKVDVIQADKLLKKDIGILGSGKSDPFVVLTVGSRRIETPVVKNSVSPRWNFTTHFATEIVQGQELSVEVWDHDDTGDNEFLGRTTILTSVVAEKGILSQIWIDLEDVTSGKIQLTLSWLEATSDPSYLVHRSDDPDENRSVKAVLNVYVDSCRNLESIKSPSYKPTPSVELGVNQQIQTTWPQHFTTSPVYEQGFVFLVSNPDTDDLKIKILDTNKGVKDPILGFLSVDISNLLRRQNMEYENMPFTIKGLTDQATIMMSMQLKVLKSPKPRSEKPPSSSIPSSFPPPIESEKPIQIHNKDVEDSKNQSRPVSVASFTEPVEREQSIHDENDNDDEDDEGRKKVKEEEIIMSTSSKQSPLTSSVDVVNYGLRQRKNILQGGPTCGRIKLSLSYNTNKERLSVIVHRAADLPGSDLPDPPDPYVKLYLLPDRHKKSKRKSEVIKDSCNPVYDEEFLYDIPLRKLADNQLEVSVIDRKGIFAKSPLMGRAVIDLMDSEIDSGITEWYNLYEEEDDSD